MEKHINYEGGKGHFVDDIQILQNQLELFKKYPLNSNYGDIIEDNFLYSGCRITYDSGDNEFVIEQGLAYIGRELVRVPTTLNLPNPCWMIRDSDEEFGTRFYSKDATNKNAFARTRVAFVSSDPGFVDKIEIRTPGIPIRNSTGTRYARYFLDMIQDLLRLDTQFQPLVDNSVVYLTPLNGWSAADGEGQNAFLLRKMPGGFVNIQAKLQRSGGAGLDICQLPNGYWPTPSSVQTLGWNDTLNEAFKVWINTAGQIKSFTGIDDLRFSITYYSG